MPFWVSRAGAALAIGVISASGLASVSRAQSTPLSQSAAAAKAPVLDTMPPYKLVRGASRDSAEQVEAAVDALVGRFGFPPPLVLTSYRREARSVVIDMRADSLPRMRFVNAGGTVHILEDGRRVIVARHD